VPSNVGLRLTPFGTQVAFPQESEEIVFKSECKQLEDECFPLSVFASTSSPQSIKGDCATAQFIFGASCGVEDLVLQFDFVAPH
jgi:hypothetical protein